MYKALLKFNLFPPHNNHLIKTMDYCNFTNDKIKLKHWFRKGHTMKKWHNLNLSLIWDMNQDQECMIAPTQILKKKKKFIKPSSDSNFKHLLCKKRKTKLLSLQIHLVPVYHIYKFLKM